jgi:hypothetical protein
VTRTQAGYLSLALIVGCGSDDVEPPSDPPPVESCDAPSRVVDGACIEPGVADDGCQAGTLRGDDGECRPAGILPDMCAPGFVHDGDVGCEPVLPAEPCPAGLMAVPGDTSCRAVMDCGSGTWGDIAVDPTTQYVDGAFVGVGDGSPTAPWVTIGEGVAAAAARGLVAVAAGSYVENVDLTGKPVRLHGVCPQQVEVVGAIRIQTGADGSELSGLAIQSPGVGVRVDGAQQVVLDRLWLHDSGSRGMQIVNVLGPTSCTVRGVLLENNREHGIFAAGADVAVEATAVRRTQPVAGSAGRGINAQRDPTTGEITRLMVSGSLIEDNHEVAVHVEGSEATLTATVVRRTLSSATPSGRGLNVQSDDMAPVRSTLTMSGSIIEDNADLALYVDGSDATIDATVVRRTQPRADGRYGRGLSIQDDFFTGAPSTAMLTSMLVHDNREVGLYVEGSQAEVESTVLRFTQPSANGELGRAVHVQPDLATLAPAQLTMRGCVVHDNHEVGVYVGASDATVEATLVRTTLPNTFGFGGRGINIQGDMDLGLVAHATLRANVIEDSRDIGVYLATSATTIESSLISGVQATEQGLFGDGVAVIFDGISPDPAGVAIDSSHILNAQRAGVASFGAQVSLVNTTVECAGFDLAGENIDPWRFNFDDRGGNLCGCPTPEEGCQALSAGLAAPEPLAESGD